MTKTEKRSHKRLHYQWVQTFYPARYGILPESCKLQFGKKKYARENRRELIVEIGTGKGRLHRAYHHPKPEDAANHLGALGTSSHFTAGQLPQRIA